LLRVVAVVAVRGRRGRSGAPGLRGDPPAGWCACVGGELCPGRRRPDADHLRRCLTAADVHSEEESQKNPEDDAEKSEARHRTRSADDSHGWSFPMPADRFDLEDILWAEVADAVPYGRPE